MTCSGNTNWYVCAYLCKHTQSSSWHGRDLCSTTVLSLYYHNHKVLPNSQGRDKLNPESLLSAVHTKDWLLGILCELIQLEMNPDCKKFESGFQTTHKFWVFESEGLVQPMTEIEVYCKNQDLVPASDSSIILLHFKSRPVQTWRSGSGTSLATRQ